MEEEQLAAEPAQAGLVSVSTSLSRDANTGTGQQQQVSQQEQAGLSVHIECHQSPLGHGPVLKEVIMSFKRRPSEELDRSFRAHGLLYQQNGLEEREPQRQGQGSLLRRSGALNVTPGQVSANDRTGWPETRRDRTTILEWRIGYTAPQQPQVTGRRFTESTINHQVPLEQLGPQAPGPRSRSVKMPLVQSCLREEWEDAVDTELCQGTDDNGSSVHHWINSLGLQDNKGSHTSPKEGLICPTNEGKDDGARGRPKGSQDMERPLNEDHEVGDGTAIVTSEAQEEPSLVGEEAADPGQAFTYTIPFSTFLDALAEERQIWHRKALSILHKALISAQGKGEQKRKCPTGSNEVLPEPAQPIRAEGLDKEHPVKQGPGQQLVEAEPDLELHLKEATEAGTPAGPAFRSPSPTVIEALAQERRTSIFKSAPRALPRAFSAMHRRGEWEQQQPTACALDLPDTARCISSEVLSKTTIVIQGLKQTEEQGSLAHSTDSKLAVRARAAGADAQHIPTADGLALLDTAPDMRDEFLSKAVIVIQGSEEHMEEQGDLDQGSGEGMKLTASVEGTERPGHTVHSHTAGVPAFLDYNDYIQTEVVKKAMLMLQEPFEYPEELQEQELSAEGSITADTSAGRAQGLPAPTVINNLARQTWLRLVQRALRAQPLASTATFLTGQQEKKHPTADGKDLRDAAECIRRDILDKATLEIQGSSQQIVEEQHVEPNRDVSCSVTPTAAGTKSHVHEIRSPTADVPVVLNAADYMHTEVVKKAMLVVQRPFDKPEPWEQEQSVDEEMGAKARAAEAGRQTRVPCTSRADGPVLPDTAQYIPAPAEGTERPGQTVHSQTADAPVFLDYNDFLQTEVVKKAMFMVQEPFEYPEAGAGGKHGRGKGNRERKPGTCTTQPQSP